MSFIKFKSKFFIHDTIIKTQVKFIFKQIQCIYLLHNAFLTSTWGKRPADIIINNLL